MNRIYINGVLYDELGCDPKIRRICDSGYIKLYKELLKKFEILTNDYNKLKEENEVLKEALKSLKGGE